MSKPKWHTDIPWLWLKRKYLKVRGKYFGIPRPNAPYYRVEASRAELIRVFGSRSWAPNYEFSYDKGEDLNLARIEERLGQHEDIVWWQFHLRAYEVDDGVWELTCHWEPEPTEHPFHHLKGTGYSRSLGMRELRKTLESHGFEPEKREYNG